MGHVRKLPCDGVRLNNISLIILIPSLVNDNQVTVHVLIHESVQVHEHAIFIGGHIPAMLVKEVKDNLAVLIDSVIVRPITCHQFQPFAIIENVTGQLLAILIACRVEVDEEVDDACEEVFG